MFPKCVIHPCLLENNQNFTNKLEIHDINIVKSKLSPILKSSMLLSPKVRSSLLLSSIKHVIDRINLTSTELIIIPNNKYGKYYPGAAAKPEYGSVFRVSLPITGLLSSWSLDNMRYSKEYLKYYTMFL